MLRPVFFVKYILIIWAVIIFSSLFASDEGIPPFSRFDKAFYEEMKFWKCVDMYVLSYELNPTLTYKMELSKEGVFFQSTDGCFSKAEEAEDLICGGSMCFEITSEEFLRVRPLRIKSSAGVYLKGRSGMEIEHFNLTSSSNLFCVLKDISSLVAAFRVLFNPEGRRASKLESTLTISGRINSGTQPSCLYIRGVRWVRLAIRPLIAYQMLKDVYEPATE